MWHMQLGRYKFLNVKFLILNCNFYITPTFIIKFIFYSHLFIYLFIHSRMTDNVNILTIYGQRAHVLNNNLEYSAPGSRIARMEIQVFRNRKSSQMNANSHYSNYSYSGLIANERTLSQLSFRTSGFLRQLL